MVFNPRCSLRPEQWRGFEGSDSEQISIFGFALDKQSYTECFAHLRPFLPETAIFKDLSPSLTSTNCFLSVVVDFYIFCCSKNTELCYCAAIC